MLPCFCYHPHLGKTKHNTRFSWDCEPREAANSGQPSPYWSSQTGSWLERHVPVGISSTENRHWTKATVTLPTLTAQQWTENQQDMDTLQLANASLTNGTVKRGFHPPWHHRFLITSNSPKKTNWKKKMEISTALSRRFSLWTGLNPEQLRMQPSHIKVWRMKKNFLSNSALERHWLESHQVLRRIITPERWVEMNGLLAALCVTAAYVNDAPFESDWIPVTFSVSQGCRGVSIAIAATRTHATLTAHIIGCGCELFKATIW